MALPKNLFSVLVNESPNKVFLAIVIGMLSGLAYALIMPVLFLSLRTVPYEDILKDEAIVTLFSSFNVSSPKFAGIFFILCLLVVASRSISQTLLSHVAVESAAKLRQLMYFKINRLPIIEIERMGAVRFHTAFSRDLPTLVKGASQFPLLFISVTTLLGLLSFIYILHDDLFLTIIAIIAVGVIIHRIPILFAQRAFLTSRECLDDLHEKLNSILLGAKELRLDSIKTSSVISKDINPIEYELVKNQKAGETLMISAITFADTVFILAIGLVAYIFANTYDISKENLIAVVMSILYLSIPITGIINSLNYVIDASVSLSRLIGLFNELTEEPVSDANTPLAIESLELHNVLFTYNKGKEDSFELGPITIELLKGEITFLVGGNGSGKSTLGKLTSLLYVPVGGYIKAGGDVVDDSNRMQYRQSIAAIFTDYYLFDRIAGVDIQNLDLVESLLISLRMNEKVRIDADRFSTVKLSDGQKKRLALLVAQLKNVDMYIFDEWAADQDPEFKEVFYKEILPDLKKRGKIVLVITHDNRYFDVADKIVYMENGRVIPSTVVE